MTLLWSQVSSLLPVIRIFCIPIILHVRFLYLFKFDIDILHDKFLLLPNNYPSLPLSLEEATCAKTVVQLFQMK